MHVIPKNKDILLYIYITIFPFKNINNSITVSSIQSMLKISQVSRIILPPSGLHTAFGCYVHLVLFIAE